MPKFSKGHNSGNNVYKVAFPIAILTKGKFYYRGKICHFPGGGGNFTTGKLHSNFPGKILVAENHRGISYSNSHQGEILLCVCVWGGGGGGNEYSIFGGGFYYWKIP